MVGIGHVDSKDYGGVGHGTRCPQDLRTRAYIQKKFGRFVSHFQFLLPKISLNFSARHPIFQQGCGATQSPFQDWRLL
jgi:hypothetical protein